MWRAVCALLVVGGCWSDDPLVDGELTPVQLARLRQDFARPAVPRCDLPSGSFDAMMCPIAERFGQELFFEPALSSSGTYSCVTCHDPKGFLIDSRQPNNVSAKAVGFTKRNAPTVVDVGTKYAARRGDLVFSWIGQYASPGAVLDLAVRKAYDTTHDMAVAAVLANPRYASEYHTLFPMAAATTDVEFQNLARVFDAYLFQLNTTSPFDRYIAGDDTAMSDSARRGFGVFVGRGTCVECHRGAALTDNALHVTGVNHTGEHLVEDDGRMDVTHDVADQGLFVTASLRNVARTAPYMHDGSIAALSDVIELYRRGGDPTGYFGVKDPRIQPLELSDDDARDLEAFLDALTADQLPDAALLADIRGCMGGVCVTP